jgi:hypothetical protein
MIPSPSNHSLRFGWARPYPNVVRLALRLAETTPRLNPNALNPD